MSHDPFAERLDAIAAVPPEWAEYASWLRDQQQRTNVARDYLFTEDRARFEPRAEDVVVPVPGLRVGERGGVARLEVPGANVSVEITGLQKMHASVALAAMDGKRCLMEVRWEAGLDAERMGKILRAGFGRVLFAPQAVASLETQMSGTTIVRFPSAPYTIERAYWENMIGVRRRFLASWPAIDSAESFVRMLRQLHVVALMGADLRTFYKPASPASDLAAAPGSLYLDEPRWIAGQKGAIFVRGPRVNVSLVGGEGWHRALAESVGEPAAMGELRRFEEDGVDWGMFLTAQSEKDLRPGAWFLPPRPLTPAHFEVLWSSLRRAFDAIEAGERDEAIAACARFHRCFVRLHPFHYANQSVAMNLVNAVIERVAGAGMPHLLLDLHALRMSSEAYARVFRRAVDAWVIDEKDPGKRLSVLIEKRARMQAAIEKLGSGGDAGVGEEEALLRN